MSERKIGFGRGINLEELDKRVLNIFREPGVIRFIGNNPLLHPRPLETYKEKQESPATESITSKQEDQS